MLQLTYNNLNWIIPWYASDYITLNRSQKIVFDETLHEILNWHRKTQLPAYATWLDGLQQEVENRRTYRTDDIALHAQVIYRFYQQLITAITPELITLFSQISQSQADSFFNALAEDNLEWKEKHLNKSPEKHVSERRKNMNERLEEWLGELTGTQRGIIRSWAASLQPTAPEQLHQRYRWQARAHTLVKTLDNPTSKRQVERLLIEPRHLWTQEYARKNEVNRQTTLHFLRDIANSLTEGQRQHLIHKLQKLSGTLKSLSQKHPQDDQNLYTL